eukprot:1537309-Prymnesium_polylepis.1
MPSTPPLPTRRRRRPCLSRRPARRAPVLLTARHPCRSEWDRMPRNAVQHLVRRLAGPQGSQQFRSDVE